MHSQVSTRAARPQPSLGARREDLDTPCLVLDLDVLERNIASIVDFCRRQGVAWRPHAKSYKCGQIARKAVDAGAIGVTCSKLGEAEVLADAGVADLLITCPIVGRSKATRFAQLSRRAAPIAVVDDPAHLAPLVEASAAVDVPLRVMIEIDLGMNRFGVASPAAALELARTIVQTPGLKLAGIMGWEGHLLTNPDRADRQVKIAAALDLLAQAKRLLDDAQIACPIVSAGGTGSYQTSATLGVATEMQAGGGIFMDQFYRDKCHVEGLDFALTLLASVISRPATDRAVLDAGRKSTNPELALPLVQGRDDLRVAWMSAEHAVLKVDPESPVVIGDRIEMVPGYGDWTTVLHDQVYAFRGERLEAIWDLDARGRAD